MRIAKVLLMVFVLACLAQSVQAQGQGADNYPLDWNDGDSGPQAPWFQRDGYTLHVYTRNAYQAFDYEFQTVNWIASQFVAFTDAWALGMTIDNEFDSYLISSDVTGSAGNGWECIGKFRCWWYTKD